MIAVTMLFSVPNYSRATGILDDWGGTLLDAVVSLFAAFGDTLTNLMEWAIVGEMSTQFDSDDLSWMPLVSESDQYYGPEENYNFPSEYESAEQIQEGSGKYRVPCISYTPREIFAGVIPALDINFIKPNYQEDEKSVASQLQTTIASWYVGLRNFSLLILLVVLVYVGIRMMLTSLAAEKAKYKQMFLDWLIAMCLIFFLHYIMSFTITMVETLTDALATNVTDINVYVFATDEEKEAAISGGANVDNAETAFSTNLTGLARFRLQYSSPMAKFMYLIIYTALVIYTLMFTITYLKRVLIMAFLTLIAPMVCMTYPIDKIGDGQAQAFKFWLREYIFNALLQPFHLLLYAIFIGSAFELATKNVIYSLVALGFIFSAEKILRKMFGFEKSGTIGTLGAFAGGALVNTMLNKMGKVSGPETKEIEQKEKADKIKALNFRNGSYNHSFDTEESGRIGAGISTVTGSENENGNGASPGVIVGNTQGGGGAIGGGTGGTLPSGGTGTPENASFAESLRNVQVDQSRFAPGTSSQSLRTQVSNAQGIRGKGATIGRAIGRGALNGVGAFGNGLTGIADRAAYKMGEKLTVKNTAKTLGKGAKFVGKTALRAGLAAGAGAVGLAAGIATGDLDKALQMGFAGAVAGSSAGKTAFNYGEKGAKALWKGAKDNIITPYQEATMGVKEVKAQKTFRDLNTEDVRQYVAEETRDETTGAYLSEDEITERIQEMADIQQSTGVYGKEDLLMASNLRREKQEEYRQKLDLELDKDQRYLKDNVTEAELARFRSMSNEDKEKLREHATKSSEEVAAMSRNDRVKHKAAMADLEKLEKIEHIDNRELLYQQADQVAKDRTNIATALRSQTKGMSEQDKTQYINERFKRNGYTQEMANKATYQVLGDMDKLDGSVKMKQ